ncbi:MAG: IS630 family transposase, partial [Psychromonas sp.]|nr:IS630 family transposase [Psychromonas sp.]
MLLDRHRGWRKAKATDYKSAFDFAHCMKELVDEDYPEAKKIRVALDNFSTHKASALYKAYPPAEALRILSKLEFHYTPKHASWLNMAEIEIGAMSRQCLDRRIADMDTLKQELSAWSAKRNEERATIKWLFDVDAARSKLHKAYDKLRAA